MRIADRLGRPLSYVLSEIPEWELPYWKSWCAREPDAGRRVDRAVAQLTRNFIAANSKKGRKLPDLDDLMAPDWYLENNRRRAAQRDTETLISLFSNAGIPIILNTKGRK